MSSYYSLKLSSAYDELDTPLLDQTEVDYDDEDDLTLSEVVPAEANATNLSSREGDLDDEETDASQEESILWLVLTGLLVSQFGMAFSLQHQSTAFLATVFISIALFVVTAALYKDALNEHSSNRPSLCILLPELMVNIILGVVFFFKVDCGFFALLVSMVTLKCAVIFMTLQSLWKQRASKNRVDAKEETSSDLLVCQIV